MQLTRDNGSSPLTRGKLPFEGFVRVNDGLIPAHAGKTSVRHQRITTPRAHPRSRGENSTNASITGVTLGSSPLTRGKLNRGGGCEGRRGLIPAHAGKTPPSRRAGRAGRAHPRSRGENWTGKRPWQLEEGSSPLTRGKLETEQMKTASDGLIPAHAGKTPSNGRRATTMGAHPRSRGENCQAPFSAGSR